MSFTKAVFQRIAYAAWFRAFPDRPNDEHALEVITQVVAKMRRMQPVCIRVDLADAAFPIEPGYAYLEIWTVMHRVYARFHRRNQR